MTWGCLRDTSCQCELRGSTAEYIFKMYLLCLAGQKCVHFCTHFFSNLLHSQSIFIRSNQVIMLYVRNIGTILPTRDLRDLERRLLTVTFPPSILLFASSLQLVCNVSSPCILSVCRALEPALTCSLNSMRVSLATCRLQLPLT